MDVSVQQARLCVVNDSHRLADFPIEHGLANRVVTDVEAPQNSRVEERAVALHGLAQLVAHRRIEQATAFSTKSIGTPEVGQGKR